MRVPSLAALLLLSLLALSRPAHAARSFDNCTGYITSVPAAISTPGTWCLKQDVATAITSGDAITVSADNVVVDCNDFRLDGLGGGLATTALGVHALNQSNVRVRHCNIRGFYRGVLLGGTGGRHVVEDNHFSQNVYNGLRVEGEGSLVRRNLITDTGGAPTGYAYGISVIGNVDVVDNTIIDVAVAAGTNTNARGIYVNGSTGASVVGNRVSGILGDGTATPHGIEITSATRLVVRNNQVTGSSAANGYGVVCDTSSITNQVRVRKNIINGFATPVLTINNCADAGLNDLTQ